MPEWWLTKDGDKDCLAMYEKHYSAYQYRDGRRRTQFVGPGETIVLRTFTADAVFVWRKFIDECIDPRTSEGQQGVNCAVFRNESGHLSSELIRQADAIADIAWPGERHYTYVDAEAVASRNPGYCFLCAGWTRCGVTKSGKLILERRSTPTRQADKQRPDTQHEKQTDHRLHRKRYPDLPRPGIPRGPRPRSDRGNDLASVRHTMNLDRTNKAIAEMLHKAFRLFGGKGKCRPIILGPSRPSVRRRPRSSPGNAGHARGSSSRPASDASPSDPTSP